MIRLDVVYILMGILVGGIAIVNLLDRAHPKRVGNALFWGLYAVSFLFGSLLPDLANGALVLGMVAVAAVRGLGGGSPESTTAEARRLSSRRWGNRLFLPALLVPVLTLIGSFALRGVQLNGIPLVDPRQVTLISLGLATLIALTGALVMLRPPVATPLREARRLLDTVGWAAVLPQSLAALGAVFAAAGVGTAVSTLVTTWIPLDHAVVAVVTYAVGMALFTIVMGNAFAAFPVMTAGVGLPLIVGKFGGDPVVMSAIGMLSGYCGTLVTPMAANYNIVPAALLELPDQHGVIRVQFPTGVALLVVNIVLMSLFVYRA